MERIDTEALKKASESLGEKEIILDVRTEEEYQDGHIDGSIQIMHEDVGMESDRLKSYEKIYVVCRSGKRAQLACQTLESQGFQNLICVSNGGMAEWSEKGYPTVK